MEPVSFQETNNRNGYGNALDLYKYALKVIKHLLISTRFTVYNLLAIPVRCAQNNRYSF